MGADFLYSTFPVIRVNAKRIKEYNKLIDAQVVDLEDDIADLIDELGRDFEDVKDLKEYMKEMFECLYDKKDPYGFRYRRDVATIRLNDGYEHYLTGGMSWGDLPTDASEYMDALWTFRCHIPKLNELFIDWQNTDQRKEFAK